MKRLQKRTWRLAAGVVLLGLVAPGPALADEALSRTLTVRNLGASAPPVERANGRAFSAVNTGAAAGPPSEAISRPFTLQNMGAEGVVESALARAWTTQNLGLAAPSPDAALARAFTLQNTDLEAPPIEESLARAFTVRQLGVSFAPGPNEAIARAVSVQNLGFIEEPGIEEVIGRAFTVESPGGVIDVPDVPDLVLPASFQLYSNVPNPVRSRTSIRYDLPRTSPVSILMYDVTGRQVKVLVYSKKHQPGRFVIDWDGLDQHGRALASGVYFYRMRADGFEQNRRLVLIRE